jgi:hypothetical protein
LAACILNQLKRLAFVDIFQGFADCHAFANTWFDIILKTCFPGNQKVCILQSNFLKVSESLWKSHILKTENTIIISMATTEPKKSRIPMALQNVFVASQTGIDVGKIRAPMKGLGFRIFNNKEPHSHHHHQPVAHQKVPAAPRRSSLELMRRQKSSGSIRSGDSNASSKASAATKKKIREKGIRAKVCRQGF